MGSARKVLILGGTSEASALVRRLASDSRFHPIVSFAGRTRTPTMAGYEIRVGGFGGPDGLSSYLRREAIDIVIDATHPFARRMRWNAAEACADRNVPRLRLERAPWQQQAGDLWHLVPDIDQAAAALAWSSRIFLTIGRRDLAAFDGYERKWFLIRAIDPPDIKPPLPGEIVLARGPYDVEHEIELINTWRIDTIVSKNSGGAATEAKIIAARRLGIKVVMIERPPNPDGARAESVEDALGWLDQIVSIGGMRTTSAS
jgi:precorrin-6A/cobalt-precorrin-6A reductase